MFGIDNETCSAGGVALRIIGVIEDSKVAEKTLPHLDTNAAEREAPRQPCRAPVCRPDTNRRSVGPSNAGADARDQGIQWEEKAFLAT